MVELGAAGLRRENAGLVQLEHGLVGLDGNGDGADGDGRLEGVLIADQAPIRGSRRSNPATFSGSLWQARVAAASRPTNAI